MVAGLLKFARLFVTVPAFELAGSVLLIAAAWGAWSIWAGLATAGVLAFVKSFDLALERK